MQRSDNSSFDSVLRKNLPKIEYQGHHGIKNTLKKINSLKTAQTSSYTYHCYLQTSITGVQHFSGEPRPLNFLWRTTPT